MVVLAEDVITWDESRQVTAELEKNLMDLNEESLAKTVVKPGIVAVYCEHNDLGFGLKHEDGMQMVFVDESGAAAERHFVNGKTGYSTLRRSLAALLRNKCDLVAVPRSNDEVDADRYENFALAELSDELLTDWMEKHLKIAVLPIEKEKVRRTVQGLINYNVPILNLQNNKENKYGAEIKRLRKQCAEQAREWEANN